MDLSKTGPARRVFMILSPRALSYAKCALESLLRNTLEPIHLHLITDSPQDKALLLEVTGKKWNIHGHRCVVSTRSDLDDSEAMLFGAYPHLRRFRNGHPCWRKITDPLLLSAGDEEMIILDPDLYFPNRFCFEATPERGLLLMWQKPNCLLPTAMVREVLAKGIPLAHHVDIGVAQWRPMIDLDWLEWLIDSLSLRDYPNADFIMHIEAIVWAAIARHEGGGYLSPRFWRCWHRSQRVRLLRKLRVPGPRLIQREPFSSMKCFHAGGEAKHWLSEAEERDWLDVGNSLDQAGSILPFVELTPDLYHREQVAKRWLRRVGYYHVFPTGVLR